MKQLQVLLGRFWAIGLVLALGGLLLVLSDGSPTSVAEAAGRKTPRPTTQTPAPTHTPTPVPNPPPNLPGSWKLVDSPSLSANANTLHAVAVVSPNDVWAVGWGLTLHWDGANWSLVANPNLGNRPDFRGVAALAANDVWAVGRLQDDVSPYYQRTLVEHWDGLAWNRVPSPNGSTTNAELLDVAAVSANDVWAVGDYSAPAPTYQRTLIEHWDGVAWSIIPSPNANDSSQNVLTGVAAVSSTDVWAVGYTLQSNYRTLIEHWDGSSWTIVPSPNIGPYGNYLSAVAALAPNDVWAVGATNNDGSTLVLHWDGSTWRVVPSPSVSDWTNSLNSISIASANDIWAVGTNTNTYYTGDGDAHTSVVGLIEHWNGTAWSIVPAVNPGRPDPWDGTVYNQLNGVAAVSTSEAWAVGVYVGSAGTNQTLIERYSVP
jgi:hypothetical protein